MDKFTKSEYKSMSEESPQEKCCKKAKCKSPLGAGYYMPGGNPLAGGAYIGGAQLGAKMDSNEKWRNRYLLLQAELVEETRKWASRLENFFDAYAEQACEKQGDMEQQMLNSYEEAYQMLQEQNQKIKLLETENALLRAEIAKLTCTEG